MYGCMMSEMRKRVKDWKMAEEVVMRWRGKIWDKKVEVTIF